MLYGIVLLVVCVFAGDGQRFSSPSYETSYDKNGRRTDAASVRNRRSSGLIIGGVNAGKGNFPEYAAVYRNGEFFCGGTILNRRSILTVTSMFFWIASENDNITVAVGKYKFNRDTGNEQYFNVKSKTYHEGFSFFASSDDIAILRLDGKIVYNDYVQPAVLSKKPRAENYTDCKVVGFGLVKETPEFPTAESPKVLQSLQVTVQSKKVCRKLQDDQFTDLPSTPITNAKLCTAQDESGACFGDQGGPLGCYVDDGTFVQYGIASYGKVGCRGINVYTRVSQYKAWIKERS